MSSYIINFKKLSIY